MSEDYGIYLHKKKVEVKKWHGAAECCQICGQKFEDFFIDGRTVRGYWALMCLPCHLDFGVGLGTGKGQKYRVSDKVKVEG